MMKFISDSSVGASLRALRMCENKNILSNLCLTHQEALQELCFAKEHHPWRIPLIYLLAPKIPPRAAVPRNSILRDHGARNKSITNTHSILL